MTTIRVEETWQQALVFDVRRQTFIDGQNIPQELEFDERLGGNYHYVLLIENGVGIATARVNFTNPGYGKIERVAVIPSHQNQGYGKRIIAEAEAWIKEVGFHKSVITSQVKAVSFYERLGYHVNPSIQLESTISTLYLEKEFSNEEGKKNE